MSSRSAEHTPTAGSTTPTSTTPGPAAPTPTTSGPAAPGSNLPGSTPPGPAAPEGAATEQAQLPDLLGYGAVLFDLDGVITPTAELHLKAWGQMFTAFFQELAAEGRPVRPYTEGDYYAFLDGRPRTESITELLADRGLDLPEGEASDSPATRSIHGLGERKNVEFLRMLGEGIQAYPGSVALLERLAAADNPPRIAIVSSSKNARPVLEAAGLLDRFELIVDGLAAAEQGLPGKPAPDTYLHAARQLGVPPKKAVVVEDALSGVASGKNGDFGLVLGVDRGAGAEELRAAGADVVVADLGELSPELTPEGRNTGH